MLFSIIDYINIACKDTHYNQNKKQRTAKNAGNAEKLNDACLRKDMHPDVFATFIISVVNN